MKKDLDLMGHNGNLLPDYESLHKWDFYGAEAATEYVQSFEEGLDIEGYKDLFDAVSKLPKNEIKKKLGDVLFEIVMSASQREDYGYYEPSDIEEIRRVRRGAEAPMPYDKDALEGKIHGAWLGRICGCMLGKTVEGIRSEEMIPFLKESGNYPMHRYIYKSDLKSDTAEKYKFNFASRPYADVINGMPVDDDTNYVILAQELIDTYGRDFTPYDMAKIWLSLQGKDSYCTAERVAYRNFISGFKPPMSAVYQNPYREWIGAQIRGDYFGYINPGDPALAAEMAWRDASISHVKNGIYGEMFVAAMLAVAAVSSDRMEIILGGLAEIPETSRLYEAVMWVVNAYNNGLTVDQCFEEISRRYDEHTSHGWCHTISNAMIVTVALLYGEGDFGRSVCMAVEACFDTDCNGATVGSVLGMAYGKESIDGYWTAPIQDTLHTSIFGVGTVSISERAKHTLEHIV